MKTIKIGDKEYDVVFDMSTMLHFENVSEQSFFESSFNTMKERILLVLCAILTADESTDMTFDGMLGNKSFTRTKELFAAFAVVQRLMLEFLEVPTIDKQTQTSEGDEIKNA